MSKKKAPKFQLDLTTVFFAGAVILVIALGTFAAYILNPDNKKSSSVQGVSTDIIEENGRQTVKVLAKNGFFPETINLKANKTASLKVVTENTYDCSNVLVIPELNINKELPISGETPIDIPAQPAGTKLTASCGMGHYPLYLNFVEG